MPMSRSCTAILTTDVSVDFIIPSLNMMLTMNGMIRRSEHKNNEKLDISGVCMVVIQIENLQTGTTKPDRVMGNG